MNKGSSQNRLLKVVNKNVHFGKLNFKMIFFIKGLLYVCVFLLVDETKSACNIEELSAVEVVNLTDFVDYTLNDRKNLSNYRLTVTYTWDIVAQEGVKVDGFLCCLSDVDHNQIKQYGSSDTQNAKPTFQDKEYSANSVDAYSDADDNSNDKTPYSNCRTYIGKTFHVHTGNGSYVTCPFPCEQYTRNCQDKRTTSVCSLLGANNCKVLPKNHRSITADIKFGRIYEFTVSLYTGHNIKPTTPNHTVNTVSLFCADHLVEKLNLPRNTAYAFCKSEQTISALSFASSPPTDFKLIDTIPNYSTNKVNLIFRWKAPHDVHLNVSVSRYLFSSTSGTSQPGTVEAKSPEEELINPYYNTTLENVPMGMELTARVIPGFRDLLHQACHGPLKCKALGMGAELHINVPRFDPCDDQASNRFCHILAHTKCNNTNENVTLSEYPTELVQCVCPHGYGGDGRNPSFVENVTGCRKSNVCSVIDEVEESCSPEADCIAGDPASKMNGICHCRSGFTGDGKVSGSGCKKDLSDGAIIGGTLAAAVVILGVLLLLILQYRNHKKRVIDRLTSAYVQTPSRDYSSSLVIPNPHILSRLFNNTKPTNPVFQRRWELERSAIKQGEIIGRGNFGVVHKGSIILDEIEQTVAVKSLSGIYTEHHIDDFLFEINFLVTLGTHENILKLIGVCTSQPLGSTGDLLSPLMVTEYMIYGDLLHFLWDSREASKREMNPIYNFSENSLYNIGRQVAHGLHFLCYKRIIHGDVAARNMLVGEDLTIKISDFGLANDVYRYGMIRCATERRVPFKWISPERMQGGGIPITWRSDVWSFGILLYEMVTLGATPYPGMEPCVIFQKLQSGYRIPQPSSCNDHLYQIMMDCWKWRATERPSFNDLEERLASIHLSDSTSHNRLIEAQDSVDYAMYERDMGRRNSITISENEPEGHSTVERNRVASHSNGNGNCCNGNGILRNGHVPAENMHSENTTDSSMINDLCHGDIAVNVEPND